MSNPADYTVGWICAISTERVAAEAFLDDEHDGPDYVSPHDNNDYTLGRIGKHNVVIAVLPDGEYGTSSAACVARDMLHTFPNVRIGLMVGIGGGVPSQTHDIRLGDIVVNATRDGKSSVVQYDFGKTIQSQAFQTTGFLNQSPTVLRTALSGLKSQYERRGHGIEDAINTVLDKTPRIRKKYRRPDSSSDMLFCNDVIHPLDTETACTSCSRNNPFGSISRSKRTEDDDNPAIHYGIIASSNQLMKDAILRDRIAAEHNVLCFEMEAAGLMNHFPCLIIRGICDYSDSHKNKEWQGYAAMAAAAFAKDLLYRIPPNKVEAERRIVEALESMQDTLSHIQSTAVETSTNIEEIRSDSHLTRIKQWLSPPDTSTNANYAREIRHHETGTWLLNTPAFKEWKSGSLQHVWLHGMPGSGKTIISTTVLDDLTKMNDHTTLSFFFDFSDTKKQTLADMLRSLAFQLYTQRIESKKEMDSLFTAHEDGQKQPAPKTLATSLAAMMQASGKIFIVLDALDECSVRGELLTWMKSFFSDPSFVHVQVVATGRPEEEFQRFFRGSFGEDHCISMDAESVNRDIRAYIEARLEQSPEFKKWASSPSVLKQIQDDIGSKADGMFRWVACQLDSLETCLDREAIEKALESLPRTLNETYARILASIPPERKHKATRLLQFLVHTERPLTIEEAVDVIAVRLDNGGSFDERDRLPCPSDITRFCPSLATLVRASRDWWVNEELQLAHFSVKEYLLCFDVEGLNYMDAAIDITETCLAYLSCVAESRIHEARFPLARYSAKIWMDHARLAESSERARKQILRFLKTEKTYRAWTRLFQPDNPEIFPPPEIDALPLYFVCLKGLKATAEALVSSKTNVSARGGRYQNALQAASFEGHREIVQILVDRGADINAQGGFFGSALLAALYQGHQEIVQLLLDRGADINAQGGFFHNALQAASIQGHHEIVQLLLDRGADINARGVPYGNALYAASSRGHQEIVQLLLDRGADINARGVPYGNALEAASRQGHREIVQILLDRGADIDAQGGVFGNALQAALTERHQDIVQMLLDRGANVNTKGGRYGTALRVASLQGHRVIVQILLDVGANITPKGVIFPSRFKSRSSGYCTDAPGQGSEI
ncbi:hypothetical protein AUP68_14761 [Ilyonectria robusta]